MRFKTEAPCNFIRQSTLDQRLRKTNSGSHQRRVFQIRKYFGKTLAGPRSFGGLRLRIVSLSSSHRFSSLKGKQSESRIFFEAFSKVTVSKDTSSRGECILRSDSLNEECILFCHIRSTKILRDFLITHNR